MREVTEHSDRVLLVDDNPTNLQVLFSTLEGRGLHLLAAKNGQDGLSVAARMQPALILLDIMMPGIDGFEVCRRLKQDPLTRDAAVIFLSALDDTESKVKGLGLGAVDYIAKPFQAEEVVARVETHLKIGRLERELARRNRELQAANQRILEAMGEGLYGLDTAGRITFVNPAATRITGWPEAEVLGRNFHSLLQHRHEDGSPYAEEDAPVHTTLTSGRAQRVEEVFWRRDGLCFPAQFTSTPLYSGEDLIGAVVVLQDITERRQAENALSESHRALLESHQALKEAQQQLVQAAKLESVGRLSAGVAHEVKNPLAIIQLGVDFLGGSLQKDETAMSVLTDIGDSVRRADTVIKGLLDFSREKKPDMEPADLNRIIEDSLALVRHELVQHNVELAQRLSDNSAAVQLDRDKMQQVFINLFMNAIQAMDRGGRLGVTTARKILDRDDLEGPEDAACLQPGQATVICHVEDTGTGIPESKVDKVFDPFFTTKPVGKGTGLGLSVTRNIIGLHGGTIQIKNRIEGGVRVTLKFKALEEDPRVEEENPDRRRRDSVHPDGEA